MIEFDDLMIRLINMAADDGVPCLVGTASRGGQPQISPKGSLAVFNRDTLCFWERSYRTALQAIEDNPQIVVYYRNEARSKEIPYRGAALRFHGRARVVREGPVRDRVWELTIPFEQSRDPDKQGFAVLIDVERVEELSGKVIMARTP